MYGKSLAHVERIVSVYPIDGADNLEMAQVLDYHVAVRKGQFSVGDFALYIEIDSIVPDGLPVEHQENMKELMKRFMASSGDEKLDLKKQIDELAKMNAIPIFEGLRSRGFKVKQVYFGKLKIYSQGILYRVSDFPQIPSTVKVGFDATDLIGIKQVIEDEVEAGVETGSSAINFLEKNRFGKFIDKKMMRYKWYREFKKSMRQPKGVWHKSFPSKSDETNIQAVFTKMKTNYGDRRWYVTEKLEGQNISIVSLKKKILGLFNVHHVGVCTHHRFIPKYDGSQFWKTVRRLNLDDKIKGLKGSWFVRGEHVGPKIQNNIYGFTDTDVYVFDVYELVDGDKKMLNIDQMLDLCNATGLKYVPIIVRNFVLPETVQELLDMSNGYSVFGKKVNREGLVFRLEDDPSVSFKVRSPVYLDLHDKKKGK